MLDVVYIYVLSGLRCSACRFSVAVTRCVDQLSYSTLDPVCAWVGDHLWSGKPPRHRTRHPGLLSLSLPSAAAWNEYLAKAGEVNRHIV